MTRGKERDDRTRTPPWRHAGVHRPNFGNEPRHEIVRRLARALAVGDTQELENLLAPGIEWKILGEATFEELAAVLEHAKSASTPVELRVLSVITHGREACIDGETLSAQRDRRNFCHVLRFASTSKTAAITKVRTYQESSLKDSKLDRRPWHQAAALPAG